MSALVTATQLSLRYATTADPIVAATDFTIEQQEILALVGPSGCGKSTILKAIAGFIPHTGELQMATREITAPGSDRGVVFQNASLYPWLNVAQNVAFGLRAASQPVAKIDQRVQQLLQLIDLQAQAQRPIFALSGGMRQRVAIARALAPQPPLLLLDEPFGALDAFTRQKMQQLILDIWRREQVSMLLITHDLTEALRCGSRIAVMSKQAHKIVKIYDNPCQGMTADELASPLIEPAAMQLRHEILQVINETAAE
ncbi:ABC transporter ATP-binding protein [Lapidilactobacillus wuchangensis]|uniref:ABC transporter ATP-binding protein n=1 Tax=Lapidilactobacillus wuchangensis TaxID=2486001 RepID=UPI000F77045D|nr:ATP-binding cassette domain-containing protein [Lapidilactobacillus wuchangensis]